MAVLGAGPHGRSIVAGIRYGGFIAYLYDDNPQFNLEPLDWGARTHNWVVGAAWPWVRQGIAERIEGLEGMRAPMGEGRVRLGGAQVSEEAVIGRHVHVCQNAVVSHGCELGDYVTVCPGAILSGDVLVGDGALIGAGAVVKHGGITIGAEAVVGAGAVVVSDVEPRETVRGNPATSALAPYQKRMQDGDW